MCSLLANWMNKKCKMEKNCEHEIINSFFVVKVSLHEDFISDGCNWDWEWNIIISWVFLLFASLCVSHQSDGVVL